MRSHKGPATNLVRYVQPQARVNQTLDKLDMVYGTVASFDMLMQSFYKLQANKGRECSLICDQAGWSIQQYTHGNT